jgi:hypothetical protein
MSENRVLRRIFGPKRDEITGDWSNINNQEIRIWKNAVFLGYNAV